MLVACGTEEEEMASNMNSFSIVVNTMDLFLESEYAAVGGGILDVNLRKPSTL
jgi:hypothetical protein